MKLKIFIILVLIMIAGGFIWNWYVFNPKNLDFPEDIDHLKYKVYWTILPLGEVLIDINENYQYEGNKAILIEANLKTTGIADKLLKLRGKIQTVVDDEKLLPMVYKEVINRAGEKKESKTLIYEQDKKRLYVGSETYILPSNTYDPLSLIYFLKNKKLSVGNIYELNINSNQSNYRVTFNIIEKVQVKNHSLLILKGKSERRIGEKARHRTSFNIYLDADTNIPVLIKAFTALGPIRIKLLKKVL